MKTEFTTTAVSIERIVARNHETVDTTGRGLLVALSPTLAGTARLKYGEVMWTEGPRLNISSPDFETAHLLKIRL